MSADQEEIWKIEGICLTLRLKSCPHRCVDIDVDFFKCDSSVVEGIDAFRHRELGRKLDGRAFAAAYTLKNEDGEVAFYLFKATAIPISEFPFFVKKRDCPPFAIAVDEL